MNQPTSATPPKLPRIVVLIITWNRVDEVVQCLERSSCLDYLNDSALIVA